MDWFEKKNASDGHSSARLFDAETGYFDPTRSSNAQFFRSIVEIASFAKGKHRRFRLIPKKLVSFAVQFPFDSRA